MIHKEADGKASFSRMLPLVSAGMIGLFYTTVMLGMMFKWWAWTDFGEGMSWGKDFVFVTVIPYLGNIGGKAVGKIGNGNGGGNGLVTNDKVMSDEH